MLNIPVVFFPTQVRIQQAGREAGEGESDFANNIFVFSPNVPFFSSELFLLSNSVEGEGGMPLNPLPSEHALNLFALLRYIYGDKSIVYLNKRRNMLLLKPIKDVYGAFSFSKVQRLPCSCLQSIL